MSLWHRLRTLWRNLTHKPRVEHDLSDEIQSFQQMLEDEKVRAGRDATLARREALLEIGGVEQLKETVRDVRAGATLEAIASELRHSARGLRRNPALSLLVVAILALGMGAATVVFSLFQAALLQPLPFRDPQHLVELWESRQNRGIDHTEFSEANFWDVRSRNHTFAELAAYHYDEANLTGDGPAEKVTVIPVTINFFRTLGVSPVLGRDFAPGEDRGGYDNRVVILGNRFWRTRFAADPAILGKTLRLNDRACTVIGVLPSGEPWINDQLYEPFGYRPNANRSSWEFNVIGRLAPGISPKSAQSDLRRIAALLAHSYPKDDEGIGFEIGPSSDWIAPSSTRRALWVLLAAVTFLQLIACLNMANLLLARGVARQREIAIRTALGAGRARLMRYIIMESLLLSGLGATLGLALASLALPVIRASEISGVPRLSDARLNVWVLAFTIGVAMLTGLLSGLAPALQAPVTAIASVLRDSDRQTGARRHGRLRAVLITGEVALSFLLLVGAGLLIRSFNALLDVNTGFQTEHRLVFSVNFPGPYYENGAGKQFLDRLFQRLSAIPEVIDAGAVSNRPVEGGDPGMSIDAVSAPGVVRHAATPPWAGWRVITPSYFQAVGLPLLRGRPFNENDKPVWSERGQPDPVRRVILSERLAKLLFLNDDPIGKHVVLWKGQSNHAAEIVGVVANSRERGPANDPTLTVYLPYGRNALTSEIVLHTRGNPLAFAPTARSLVASLDPNLPVADVRSLDEVVSRALAPQRFSAVVLGAFSGFAMLLAMAGLYGVVSYSISRRTPEIGLRVALGASRSDILSMAVHQGMRPALVGIGLGAVGASWLSHYLAALLFEIKPLDLTTYCTVTALLLATALFACYLPGRRAMRIDPVVALRTE